MTDGTNVVNWDGEVRFDVTGGYGNDTITGTGNYSVIDGYSGNDTINSALDASKPGGGGFLFGGEGNDVLNSLAGAADSSNWEATLHLNGGSGNDTLNAANGGFDIVNCGDPFPGEPRDQDVANVDAGDIVEFADRSTCETVNIVTE